MASQKENLPLNLEQDTDSSGTITYANEVIAIISGVAASEVEGIAGMCTSGGISEVFGRNKNITKGVRVELGTEEVSVDLYVTVEYGTPIQTAAMNVQENVGKAIESMTGLHVVRVDVHVQGVSFEKENKEALAGLEQVALADGEEKPQKPIKISKRAAAAKKEKEEMQEAALAKDENKEEVAEEPVLENSEAVVEETEPQATPEENTQE